MNYLNFSIMQLHKENYSVSYTNNICVSLLHASSNKTLPTLLLYFYLYMQKTKLILSFTMELECLQLILINKCRY